MSKQDNVIVTEPAKTSTPAVSNSLKRMTEKLQIGPYKHKRKFFIGAVVLQLVLLSGLIVAPACTLANSQTVTFTTAPVDPWDMFRGDYVTLTYDFTNAPSADSIQSGSPVYVVLKKAAEAKRTPDAGDTWVATRVETTKPVLADDEIMLKGRVESSYEKYVPKGNVPEALPYTNRIRYGLERAFVAEGTGKSLDRSERMQVDVAIDRNGSTVIKEVRHKGDSLFKWRLI